MLEFPIKRTIVIDDKKKKGRGRKKKGGDEKMVIKGTVHLPEKQPLKKMDPLPKNAKNLVIVESPAKAKTIERFLGSDYKVMASRGHLRDLPRNQFGVNIEDNFTPTYTNMFDKRKLIEDLQNEYVRSKTVYLATDPDREGEAISWHLAYLLDMDPHTSCRVMFHEITKKAVLAGMENPQPIDLKKVDAQQARRVLDRIVGYKLSPLLWKKVCKGLSAGRVQSVAVRLICEREEEIKAFVPEEYWTVEGTYKTEDGLELHTELTKIDGKKASIENGEQAAAIASALQWEKQEEAGHEPDRIEKVEKRKRKRQPQPPFTTSTMQQECVSKLNFGAKKTMMLAQQLYEGLDIGEHGHVGLITYMRTDSVRINDDMVQNARDFITATYGKEYIPAKAHVYKAKQSSQDAHEAIRPSVPGLTPDEVDKSISGDTAKLYRMIWSRFMASQMADCQQDTVSVTVYAGDYRFKASGYTVTFDGFTVLYEEATDEKEKKETSLPPLEQGQLLKLKELKSEQKFTQPPARYTEATLIKALEENGIGRPSTYAPIITTIIDRGYVEREQKKLKPTLLGRAVDGLMLEQFPHIVDVDFSAEMEKNLDKIESGKADWHKTVDDFYQGFAASLEQAEKNMEGKKVKVPDEPSSEVCDLCGRPMVIKVGKYGKFLACSGFPECRGTKRLVKDTGGVCPKCGKGRMLERKSAKGRIYYGCERYPDCDFMTWDTPVPTKCEKCGSTLFRKGSKLYCAKEGCGFEMPVPKKD